MGGLHHVIRGEVEGPWRQWGGWRTWDRGNLGGPGLSWVGRDPLKLWFFPLCLQGQESWEDTEWGR